MADLTVAEVTDQHGDGHVGGWSGSPAPSIDGGGGTSPGAASPSPLQQQKQPVPKQGRRFSFGGTGTASDMEAAAVAGLDSVSKVDTPSSGPARARTSDSDESDEEGDGMGALPEGAILMKDLEKREATLRRMTRRLTYDANAETDVGRANLAKKQYYRRQRIAQSSSNGGRPRGNASYKLGW